MTPSRPTFFEGQYIGAADLTALADHARQRDVRHALGAHAWGIIAGLALVERPRDDGTIDVELQPGYAVDGYGRAILVPEPYLLPVDLFSGLPTGGTTEVWIRAVARPAGADDADPCNPATARSRLEEGFEVEVGAQTDRQRPVTVAEAQVLARDVFAPTEPSEGDPLLCDESVPFQHLPVDDGAMGPRWLVPLGLVHWNRIPSGSGSPGHLVPLADARESRVLRRYVGAVAEDLLAADGLVRVRARLAERPAAGEDAERACPALDPVRDLDADGTPTDLLWVEGNARFRGDARLFGGQLELRDETGQGYVAPDAGVPVWLRREPENLYDGLDFQMLIGDDPDGTNRIVMGLATVKPPADPADDPTTTVQDLLVVQSDGRVGIGPDVGADALLDRPLTVRGLEDGLLLGFEDSVGARTWAIDQENPDGDDGLHIGRFVGGGDTKTRLFLRADGDLGLNTAAPEARLDIADVDATTGNPLGQNLWIRVGNGEDDGRFWVQYGPQSAPLAVLSDLDDAPRVQFQKTGTGTEAAPQHAAWIGMARGGSAPRALALTSSRVYVADDEFSLNPLATFDVAAGRLTLDGDLTVDGATTLNGTTDVNGQLDVDGNIRLGAGASLHAVAAPQALRIVAGQVGESGPPQSGSGFTSSRVGEGRYRVDFTAAFSGSPAIVASALDDPQNDTNVVVVGISSGGFDAVIRDIEDFTGGSADLNDSAFSFIAIGAR